MKKIQQTIIILCSFLLLPSCENDGGDSKINTQNGALPNIQKLSNSDSFIDLLALENNEEINLGFSADLALGKISSMDIVGFYIKPDGTLFKATLAKNITTFPTSFTLRRNDLYKAFENLNTPESFEIGDKLTISADLTLKDGTVLKIINDDGTNNFSSNIATSTLYKVFQTYNVSCPSDLGGTYKAISSGKSTESAVETSNPVSNFPYTVTLIDNGGGNYTIKDAFAGLYIYWYDIFGVTFETEGTFNDVCGTISGNFEGPFGEIVIYSGTVNQNGSINIHWTNEFDDFGDMILTKI